jgi:hypothetical protein
MKCSSLGCDKSVDGRPHLVISEVDEHGTVKPGRAPFCSWYCIVGNWDIAVKLSDDTAEPETVAV